MCTFFLDVPSLRGSVGLHAFSRDAKLYDITNTTQALHNAVLHRTPASTIKCDSDKCAAQGVLSPTASLAGTGSCTNSEAAAARLTKSEWLQLFQGRRHGYNFLYLFCGVALHCKVVQRRPKKCFA